MPSCRSVARWPSTTRPRRARVNATLSLGAAAGAKVWGWRGEGSRLLSTRQGGAPARVREEAQLALVVGADAREEDHVLLAALEAVDGRHLHRAAAGLRQQPTQKHHLEEAAVEVAVEAVVEAAAAVVVASPGRGRA